MATSRSNVFNSTGSITASGDARIHVGNSHRHLHIHSEAVREETEQLRISFLQRLRACPYEERKNRNPQRAEGTCGWFTRHTRFQNWRRQRSALLWVSADPGCGKSVLSRYLIDAVLPVSDDRIVCYFFFKDDFEDQRTLSIALRCILHQLFRQEPSLLSSEVLKQFQEDGDFLIESAKDLISLLLDVASRCAREIVCILDALDECSDSKQLIEALTATFVGGQGTHRLKVIATSRPYRIIRSDFATLEGVQPTIHLSGESKEEANQISEEISVVIQQHIAQLTKLRQLSSTQAESLRAAMAASENRTYLWVYLVFADLDKASLLNQYALQEAIEALPQELDEAYDGILSKSENPAQVLTVLQIIVAAERPLHLREMAVALALGGKEYHAYQELEADVSDATQLQQEIRDLCGLFIVVVDERLFLLHQTAREFLVRPSSWTVQRLKWRHAVDLSLAHAVLADLCMRYLLLQPASTLGPKVRGIHITGEPLQDSVFLGYAALHWPEHYRHGATQASNELDSMAHTLCVQQESWLGVHTSNCAVDRHDDKPITPLEVAAYFGLHPLIHLIVPPLGSGRRVNWWDVGRALALASRHGHAAFIETILKSHISETQAKARTFHSTEMLDRISLFKGRALIRATTHGHHHIVEMLLEAGADANFIENNSFLSYLTGRAKATPLSTAARRGDDRIVRLLIQYGANSGIESRFLQQNGTTSFNPLTKAAFEGDCAQLKLLLSRAHPVNEVDASGDTALLRATKQGHHDAVELLLNHDAEIDAVDPDRRTALLCAVEAEAQAIVYLLVTRNANIGASAGKYPYSKQPDINILQKAVHLGKTDIIQVLLSHSPRTTTAQKCRDLAFWEAESPGIVELFLRQGTSPDVKNQDGISALSCWAWRNRTQIVQSLLSHGALVDAQDRVSDLKYGSSTYQAKVGGGTALCAAASAGHADVLQALINHGAQVEATDGNGRTSLSLAALAGHVEVMQALIDHGAQIETSDDNGLTALSWAARSGHVLAVRLLLKYGAQIEARDSSGRTPLHYALVPYPYDLRIRHFILDGGAQFEELGYVYEDNRCRVLELLLDRGAQLEAADHAGSTALYYAVSCAVKVSMASARTADQDAARDAIRILLSRGANREHRDKQGRTPLIEAASQDSRDAIKLLLEHGAQVEASDPDGHTALWWAYKNRHRDVIRILRAAGAKGAISIKMRLSARFM